MKSQKSRATTPENSSGSASEKAAPPASLSYRYKDALYLNITAKCPTACEFCIKFSWNYRYRSHNLLLKKEPTAREILDSAGDPSKYSEIVFCGYGESTYRLAEMKEISRELRKKGARKIRLNTIGLGNLINGRNIAPELAQIVDVVSISLNTTDPDHWAKIHRPLPEFRKEGFESVLSFIRECSKTLPATFVTAVVSVEKDMEKFESFVKGLGANVRFRPYLDEYESS